MLWKFCEILKCFHYSNVLKTLLVVLFILNLSCSLPLVNIENDEIKAENNHDPVDPISVLAEDYNNSKKYIVMDDMIITKDPSRAGIINNIWPDGIVPFSYYYTIAPQQRIMIAQAMSEIASRSCIQFRPAKNDDTSWILFQNDPRSQGCSSFVGWQNRKNQPIQLSNQCSKGNAIHEIIHAVGFFHEQTRNDRDEYVKIYYDNITPGFENNFRKENDMNPSPETVTYDIAYNYDSIMHYGKNYFSKNGQPTIEPLNNPTALGTGDNIGQRDFISQGDIEMLNKRYNCPTLENAEGESPTTSKPHPQPSNPMCQITPTLPMCR